MRSYRISSNSLPTRSYTITDQSGRKTYLAKWKFNLVSEKFILQDYDQNKLATITRIPSLAVPHYKISVLGQPSIYIKRKLAFQVGYSIHGKPWEVTTDTRCEEYTVTDRDQHTLFQIGKDQFTMLETGYVLTVEEGSDPMFGLCIAIAIDSAMRAISSVK